VDKRHNVIKGKGSNIFLSRQLFNSTQHWRYLFTRLLKIVVGLQSHPECFARAKHSGKAQSGIGADAAFAEDDFVDTTRRDAD
jgi:hypothetical protein